MDEKIRVLERQAAQGDEQALGELYRLREKIEPLSGFGELTADLARILRNGRIALIASMQTIIANYPVTGFVYEAVLEGDRNCWLTVNINLDIKEDWFGNYFYMGHADFYDTDIDCISEILNVSDADLQRELVSRYQEKGQQLWDTLVVLRKFRKLFDSYNPYLMFQIMGCERWAVMASGMYPAELEEGMALMPAKPSITA